VLGESAQMQRQELLVLEKFSQLWGIVSQHLMAVRGLQHLMLRLGQVSSLERLALKVETWLQGSQPAVVFLWCRMLWQFHKG
jgi:hypothetical protein